MTWSGILEVTSNSLIEISRCFSPTIMISANEFRVLFFSQQHPTTLTPFSLAFLTASIIDSVSPNHTITEEKGEDGNRQQGPTEKDVELAARIHKVMVEGQIYRDNSLSLDTFSQKLEVTRETVSRAINRTTGKNFTRFLNEYRVKEAVRILSTGRNHTVNFDELAEQVGFNSRVTFHRAFKQLTGLPPAEFKRNS